MFLQHLIQFMIVKQAFGRAPFPQLSETSFWEGPFSPANPTQDSETSFWKGPYPLAYYMEDGPRPPP
jgi:hypothetical protein